MLKSAELTKARIVDAASALFYEAGIRAVGVDAIAERAGITKRTLYYHFASKDDLVAAYLYERDQPNLALFARWFDQTDGPVEAKIVGMFTKLARNARHPKWRGCGFLRTSAELANLPGHPALRIGAAHKKKFEAFLAVKMSAAGIGDATALAAQIALLMDGAFCAVLLHKDPSYLEQAGRAAEILVIVARAAAGGQTR